MKQVRLAALALGTAVVVLPGSAVALSAVVESLATKPDGAFAVSLRFQGSDDELRVNLVACRRLRVYGAPLAQDRGSVALDSHLRALGVLRQAHVQRASVDFGWQGMGPRIVNRTQPCTVRSRLLTPANNGARAVLATRDAK